MNKPIRRRLALMLGLAVAASLSVAAAAPAGAAALDCTTVLNTTPGIEVDPDGDGDADYRAPRIYDVTLCTDVAAGYVVYPPTIDPCDDTPKSVRCMAVYVTYLPVFAGAHAEGELCFSIEGGGRTCQPLDSGHTVTHRPRTACIGYDLDGGHPCSGSIFTLE